MILNKLSVNNFGPYRGFIEIDFKSDGNNGNGKSVFLFGGKNGAGKTNLFDAVNLCLYGSISIGRGATRKEYEDYLLEKIHRNGVDEKPLDEASVSLEFTHAHLGILDTYFINRHWKRNGHCLQEGIEVKKNGEPYKNLSQDQWDTFIKELIPPIIAQIFFFDGEKIRRLSGDRTSDNIYLADSIKSLLGIDLTERLRDDLVIYQKKFTAKMPDEMSYVNERLKLQEQKRSLEEKMLVLRQDRAGIESRVGGLTAQIKKLEDKLASVGGEFYSKRENRKAEEFRLKAEVEDLQNRIAELCQHLYPFSLCKKLCDNLKVRINKEQNYLKAKSNGEYAQEFIGILISRLKNSLIDKQPQYYDNFEEFCQLFKRKGNELFNEGTAASSKISVIHELSINETEKILMWINEAMEEIPIKMKSLGEELRQRNDRLFEIEKDLARTPPEEVLRTHIEELNAKNQDLGTQKQKALELDEKISGIAYQNLLIERSLRKYDQDAAESDKLSEKVRLIAGTQGVLTSFADSLRHKKILMLEDEILSLFVKVRISPYS
jgi:DNA sulfur modification protein DndD